MPRSIFVCVLLASSSAVAQPFSFGVIGGASLTEDFQNKSVPDINYLGEPDGAIISYSAPKRWIAGATVDVRLPYRLSIEADALYHELEYTQALRELNGTLNSVSPNPVVTWEYPLLLKYRFSVPIVKPFINAGPAFRTAGNLNGTSPSNHGLAAGFGQEAHIWKLKISPQFRYLRWARVGIASNGFFAPSTVHDQVEFLTAITFP